MQLQLVMQSEHGQLLLVIRSMSLFPTTMVWECQCSMHGQRTTRFLHLDTMQTAMQLQQLQKATAEQFHQHADVQAYLTLRVLRNALDGVDVDTGIGTADEAGNQLEEGVDYRYSADERSYYALNVAVTADNYQDFTDSTKVYDKVSKQLDSSKSPSKKVWLDIYNASDNFLSSTYQPLLQNYDDLLNLK